MEVLISEEQLKARLDELAAEITHDYKDLCPVIVCVLKGAVIFMADLVRRLDFELEIDFMAVSSYGSSTDSSGVVRILKDLDTDIKGRHVLVVEDIIDSGLTLTYLLKNLNSRGPASLEVCTLLNKPSRRKTSLPCRYTGFSIPDAFVIGYGLDYAEQGRNLSFIAELDEADR
ncbi:MAG: hypoxanthine phosphoribosyltransferase, partial [Actinobacteria bacterium]|nr:hypoxanthine phosphoribosyltransferase [Actinomycetota bacterium]